MRTKNCLFVVLIVTALSGVADASADTMAITYRSGKVQTVIMELPSEEVQAVSYFKDPVPPAEIKAKDRSDQLTNAVKGGRSDKPADAGEGVRTEQPPAPKKQGVTIKWAPPMDQ
jgi:hypothetical protein